MVSAMLDRPQIATEAAENAPTHDDVQAALERIVTSNEFRSSPHLAAFLRFSVEKSLSGEGLAIKAYSVATSVLGRPPTFDPQADPIVRVEATRLRRAIERYYLHEGADDPVLIDIPRGRYIAFFSYRSHATRIQSAETSDRIAEAANGTLEPAVYAAATPGPNRSWLGLLRSTWANLNRGERRSVAIFAYALIGALVTWGILPSLTQMKRPIEQALVLQPLTNSNSPDSTQIDTGALPRVDGAGDRIMFAMLQLTPFYVGSEQGEANEIARRLINQIASRSRSFEGIPVIDPEMPSVFVPYKNDHYALVGSIFPHEDNRNNFDISARLVHQATREIVWTHNFSFYDSAKSSDQQIQNITDEIVAALTGLYGAIRVDDARRHHDTELASTPCQMCLSNSEIALRTNNAELIAKSISCLSALSAKRPEEPLLFKQLAALRIAHDTRGPERAGDVTGAISNLETALRLDPDDQIARNTIRQLQSAAAFDAGADTISGSSN